MSSGARTLNENDGNTASLPAKLRLGRILKETVKKRLEIKAKAVIKERQMSEPVRVKNRKCVRIARWPRNRRLYLAGDAPAFMEVLRGPWACNVYTRCISEFARGGSRWRRHLSGLCIVTIVDL